jgi:hypothetical protein
MIFRKNPNVAFLSAIVFVGCASTQVPTEQLTQSKSAIRAAEEVGAPSQPTAALHLKLAQDQVRAAEALIEEGDTDQAKVMLTQASLDAELALALARQQRLQAEASQAAKRVQELKQKSP